MGNFFNTKETTFADFIEQVNSLPVAQTCPVFYDYENKHKEFEEKKAIVDAKTGEVFHFASDHYAVIQHRDAFNQILTAMNLNPKEKVKGNVTSWRGRARMSVTFPELLVDDGKQGIELGFRASNSYCGDQAFRFFGARTAFKATRVIEFFGLRKVCSNGMMVRIPLNEVNIEAGDRVERKEYEQREEYNISDAVVRILHKGDVKTQLFNITKAIEDLRTVVKPLENKIALAKETQYAGTDLKKILHELGFSDKIAYFVEKNAEDYTNWGLYNGLTQFASNYQNNLVRAEKDILKAQIFLSNRKFGDKK